MPEIIDGIAIKLELDAAPFKKALAEIQAITEKTAKRLSAALRDVSPAVDDLTARFEELDTAITKTRLSAEKLRSLENSLDRFTRSSARASQRPGSKHGSANQLGNGNLSGLNAESLSSVAIARAEQLDAQSGRGSAATLVVRVVVGAGAGALAGGLPGAVIGGGVPIAEEVFVDIFDPDLAERLRDQVEALQSKERILAEANERLSTQTRILSSGNSTAAQKVNPERLADAARREIAELTKKIETNKAEIVRLLKEANRGLQGPIAGAAEIDALAARVTSLGQAINQDLSQAIQHGTALWPAWQEAALQAICAVETKVKPLAETLRRIASPDGRVDSNRPPDLEGGSGRDKLGGGIDGDRLLGARAVLVGAVASSQEDFAEQIERQAAVLPALEDGLEGAAQAHGQLRLAVAEAEAGLAAESESLLRLRAESDSAGEALLGLTGSLFQQSQALLQNAETWQDWAAGVIKALTEVLNTVLNFGQSGGGSGGLGGFGELFGLIGGFFGGGGGFTSLGGGSIGVSGLGSFGQVGLGSSNPFAFGFAGGGDPPVGRAALVGERGPELILPKLPTRVFSHADTRALLAGAGDDETGGGVTMVQNISINGRLTAAERAEGIRTSEMMAAAAVSRYRAELNRGGPVARESGRRR